MNDRAKPAPEDVLARREDGECAWCGKYLFDRAAAREHMLRCDRHPLAERAQAAEADADRLALHLRRAIHDLIDDWIKGEGPLMRYDEAQAALAAHDERKKR